MSPWHRDGQEVVVGLHASVAGGPEYDADRHLRGDVPRRQVVLLVVAAAEDVEGGGPVVVLLAEVPVVLVLGAVVPGAVGPGAFVAAVGLPRVVVVHLLRAEYLAADDRRRNPSVVQTQ